MISDNEYRILRDVDGRYQEICEAEFKEKDCKSSVQYDEIQDGKADKGKLRLSLVPLQIIRDIAEVRMFGIQKYTDPDNWKTVSVERFRDALFRHLLLYLENPDGVDEESGLKHYKHIACNIAFICALENKK